MIFYKSIKIIGVLLATFSTIEYATISKMLPFRNSLFDFYQKLSQKLGTSGHHTDNGSLQEIPSFKYKIQI